ncbi:MAG: hypothetical protein JRI68_03745 [Deltaproteobacteria bacterium]|nr:hypothetical protein [Deltaproteobacteria bacterium]
MSPTNPPARRKLVIIGAVGLAWALAGVSCATLIGADGDYYEVGTTGTGGGASSSTGTAGAGGASSSSTSGQGGGGQGGGVAGAGGVAPILWSSWDVVSDDLGARVTAGGQTASVELYRSVSLTDLTVDAAFDQYHAGPHPEAFNQLETYWAFGTNPSTYPYAGKSTINRGDDTGELSPPSPLGVRDFQLHPPDTDQLVVMAFVVPVAAAYTASDLAVRRVHYEGGNASLVLHSPCNDPALTSLQAQNDQTWVVSTPSYGLGNLVPGDRICFGVSRDDGFAWDAVEVAWTLTAQP